MAQVVLRVTGVGRNVTTMPGVEMLTHKQVRLIYRYIVRASHNPDERVAVEYDMHHIPVIRVILTRSAPAGYLWNVLEQDTLYEGTAGDINVFKVHIEASQALLDLQGLLAR